MKCSRLSYGTYSIYYKECVASYYIMYKLKTMDSTQQISCIPTCSMDLCPLIVVQWSQF